MIVLSYVAQTVCVAVAAFCLWAAAVLFFEGNWQWVVMLCYALAFAINTATFGIMRGTERIQRETAEILSRTRR